MSHKVLATAAVLAGLSFSTVVFGAQESLSPASGQSQGENSASSSVRSVLTGPTGSGLTNAKDSGGRSSGFVSRSQAGQEGASGQAPLPDRPARSQVSSGPPPLRDPEPIEAAPPSAPVVRPGERAARVPQSLEEGSLPALQKPLPSETKDSGTGRRPANDSRTKPRVDAGVLSTSKGPSLRHQTLGPRTIVVGKEADYQVDIINEGAVPAEGVHVRVELPSSVQIVRAETKAGPVKPQDDGTGQRLLWTVDQIAAGGSESIKIKVKPTDRQPFQLDVSYTMRPSSATAQIEVQQPELKLAVFGPKEMPYGKTETFTIQLTNPGTGDAEGVVLDFLYGKQRLEPKAVGTLGAGEQTEVSVELTTEEAGLLRIAAVASATGGLRSEASHQVTVRRARLEIEIVGPSSEYAGNKTAYQVRLINSGDAVASGVAVNVILPQGAKPVSSSEADAGQGKEMSWRIGSLPPGADRTVDLQCVLTQPGENRIEARSVGDGELAAVDSLVTQVEAVVDLKLLVNDPQGPSRVGENATFEVRIMNRGSKAAERVHVVAQFSEGIEPVEVVGGAAQIVPGQVLFKAIDSVEPGKEIVLKVIARAERDGNHRFRAQLTCGDTRLVHEETSNFVADSVSRTASRKK